MTLYGIDVSHYQATSSYTLSGRSFLIAKASEGGVSDARYAQHIAKAKAAGRVTGAYCFNRADLPIGYQVDEFIRIAGDVDLYAIDVEEEGVGGTQRFSVAQAREFMDRFRAATGKAVGLYMSEAPYRSGGYKNAGHDWLWIAHYGLPAGAKPGIPYDIWQYSSSGGLDKDRFEGTREQLLALGLPSAPPSDLGEPMGLHIKLDVTLPDGDPWNNLRHATVKTAGAIRRVADDVHVAVPAGADLGIVQTGWFLEVDPPTAIYAFNSGNELHIIAATLCSATPLKEPATDCTAEVQAAITADRAKAHIVYS